ncbi:MAG: type II secretion system protein, partial [Candidatus Nanoperiomorbaceae bacterium]
MSKNNNYYHHHSSNGLLTTSASTPASTTTPTPTFPNPSPNPMGGGLNGFTIIEVALVLAISGLIFLVVFIAWPALQNSQADTARRQDVGRVVSAIESYKVDNQGTITAYSVQSSAQRIVHGGTGSFNDVNLGAYVV